MLQIVTPLPVRLGATVRIDVVQQRLWRDGKEVALRPKAWQTLAYLVGRPEELVTGDELLEAVWPGQDVSSKTMANVVSELRAALGDDSAPYRYLHTVHRRGYRLVLQPTSERAGNSDAQAVAEPRAGSRGRRGPEDVGPATDAAPLEWPHEHDRSGRLDQKARASADAPPAGAPIWVNRAAELMTLDKLLGRAIDGQRQVALVAGDPGVGKSALIDRFLSRLTGKGAVAARGSCLDQVTAREPFGPMLGLLGELCNGPLALTAKAALRRCAPTWLTQLPWLVGPAEWPELRKSLAGSGQGRMLREFAALLQALCQHAPLVLVLEDLHWADTATIDLLNLLGSDHASLRLLILASYQPALAEHTGHPVAGLATRLATRHDALELRLGPLSGSDVGHWIGQRFGDPALAEQLRPWAQQQSTGIPLYVKAALEHLVDTGMVFAHHGQWQLYALPVRNDLAEPLRRLIASRFARLSADARQMLQAASLIGMQVPVQLLAAVLDRDPTEVEQACSSTLRGLEYVRAGKPQQWPDGTRGCVLEFAHNIYREALFDGLSPGQRRVMCGRLARRLEAGWGNQVAQVAGQLASAYAGAASPEDTARVLEMTAQVAAQRLSYGATLEALGSCLEQLSLTPPSDARDATELRVQLMLGNISLHAHGVTDQRTLGAFGRARTLAQRTGSARDQIRAQFGLIIGWAAGCQDECAALAMQTVTLAEAAQPSLLAAAHHYAGLALMMAGDLPKSVWHQDRSLEMTPDPSVPLYMDVPGSALVHRGRALIWMGRTAEGLASMEDGVERCRATGLEADLIQKLYWAGDGYRFLGLPRAAELLAEARERAERHDLSGLRAAIRVSQACSRPPAERDTALIETLAPAYCCPGDHRATLNVSLALAEAHLAQGRVAAAQAAWAQGRAVTPAGPLFECEVLRLQGHLALATGGLASEAESHWQAGLSLALRCHSALNALRCAEALCRSMKASGRADEGRALLAAALAAFDPGPQTPDQLRARELLSP